jgi:hypothetical protein
MHSLSLSPLARSLASNFFNCNESDYSSPILVTDHATWKVQCGTLLLSLLLNNNKIVVATIVIVVAEFSCPFEELSGTLWPATQDYESIGECRADFKGNPARQCLRFGIDRQWSEEVVNPCLPISPLEQLGVHGLLLFIPFGCVALLLSLHFGFTIRPSIQVLKTMYYAGHFVVSIVVLCLNCWFIWVIHPFNETLSYIGIGILLLWTVTAIGFSVSFL